MELLRFGWNYINEGNAHIVIQITDTEHVLRFIKEDGRPISLKEVQNSTMFVNLVMAPLLNRKVHQEIIELPEDQISQLSEALHYQRPQYRRFKSKLSQYALRTLNLTILSPRCHVNYCVEIKPKEGFLASSLKTLSRCYFCLNQYLKLDSQQIRSKSQYCPLDLFSGDRTRMKKALINLISNPQNNFKIFKDGKVVFSESSELYNIEGVIKDMNVFNSMNIFLDFLIETLLSCDNQFSTNIKETPKVSDQILNDKCLESKFEECNSKQIPFIKRLLQIQKQSDALSIDLKNIACGKEYVQDILNEIKKGSLDVETDRKTFLSSTNPLHLAMISAVAKDCSLMISFASQYVENHKSITIDNKKIPYRVSITDLEPKDMESLLRRKKRERKIIDAYERYVNKEVSEDM